MKVAAAKRVEPQEELLAWATERIEKRKGPRGPEWRASWRAMKDGKESEMRTEWMERTRFMQEYALLHRRRINFLLGDVMRPLIGS